MILKFVSESSNSFRLQNEAKGFACSIYLISSFFLFGRQGSSMPVLFLVKIWEARRSLFNSSSKSCLSVVSVRKEAWNLTSSMYFSRALSFSSVTSGNGR